MTSTAPAPISAKTPTAWIDSPYDGPVSSSAIDVQAALNVPNIRAWYTHDRRRSGSARSSRTGAASSALYFSRLGGDVAGSTRASTTASTSMQRGGDQVRRPPAQPAAQRARKRPGQQDAAQQAGQQGAGHRAAALLRDQPGGHRQQDLRHHRGDAHRRARHQQDREGRGGARGDQAGRGEDDEGDDQQPRAHPVTQRHQQVQPRRVAELRGGDQQRRRGRRGVQVPRDERAQRLREVHVGHADAAGDGEDQDRGAGEVGGGIAGRGVGGRQGHVCLPARDQEVTVNVVTSPQRKPIMGPMTSPGRRWVWYGGRPTSTS